MPDREKVINGLREMSCRATWKDIDRIRHKFQPIINDAIAMLKEQEAVEPVCEQDSMVCGNCGHEVVWQKLIGDNMWADEQLDYCPKCGRKVKWN